MTAFRSTKMWRTVAADVVAGVRYVSHNTLALLGLLAVTLVVFMAGKADWRHSMETRALGWLMERAAERTTASAARERAEPGNIRRRRKRTASSRSRCAR